MAGKPKSTFDCFKHSTKLHARKDIIPLINRFKNLSGYGVYVYLMELCAANAYGKILFTRAERAMISASCGVEELLFNEIVEYMANVLKIVTIDARDRNTWLIMNELELLQKKRALERESPQNRHRSCCRTSTTITETNTYRRSLERWWNKEGWSALVEEPMY